MKKRFFDSKERCRQMTERCKTMRELEFLSEAAAKGIERNGLTDLIAHFKDLEQRKRET